MATPDAKVAELKEATRAANETLAELKLVRREIRASLAELEENGAKIVETILGGLVEAGLKKYQEAIDVAIEEATQAVHVRFDRLTNILLGIVDKKKTGRPSLEDRIHRMAARMAEEEENG